MGAVFACCALNACECVACLACSCFTRVLGYTFSQAARFSHFLIILIVFVFAIILGQSYPHDFDGYTQYTSLDLTSGCNYDFFDSCIYNQLIYRASAALVVVFLILALLSAFSDAVNKGFWIMKLFSAVGLFIAFWWGGNGFFKGWAQATRIISFFWLLVQGLLLLDFAHDIHEVMIESADAEEKKGADSRGIYATYLLLSGGALAGAIVGLVYLFRNYAGCGLGLFFIILTLIVGVITTGISLLNQVQRGLLTPCIMFAYSVFLCWYALLSNPDKSCNPYADSVTGPKTGAVIVIAVITMAALLYCVFNGTTILNIFNPEGQGVVKSYNNETKKKELEAVLTGEDKEKNVTTSQPSAAAAAKTSSDKSEEDATEQSGTVHERVFFHVLMVLACAYGAMILTNWGPTNGSPEDINNSTRSQGLESMWLKIVSQWVFLILYFRVLQVAYQDNAAE